MRRRLLTYGVLVVFMVLLAPMSRARIPMDNLVGLWLFDDGKGEELKDSSGKKNPGKLINGPEWVKGKFEGALKFDAAKPQQRVEVPDSESLNPTEQLSITAWGWLEDTNGNRRFIQKSSGGGDNQYRLLLEWGSFKFDAGPGVTPKEVTTGIFSTKEWHHVAGTYDGKEIVLYIDGDKKQGMAASGKMIPSVGGILFLGTKWAGAPAGDYWNGMIDELAVFNKGLTEAEIKDVMKGFKSALAVESRGKLATRWADMKTR